LSNQHQQATAPISSNSTNRQQQHQQAATAPTGSWQQAAGTVFLDITNCINF